MQLLSVRIRNYRSIKNVLLEFDPKCRILVGINESGKTNILDALNLLDPAATTSQRDIREPGRDEPKVTESSVIFYFRLDPKQSRAVYEASKNQILGLDESTPMVRSEDTELSLEQYCEAKLGAYVVNLKTQERYASGVSDPALILNSDWWKPSPEWPSDYVVPSIAQGSPLSPYRLFHAGLPGISQIPSNYIQEASIKDLDAIVSPEIGSVVENNLLKLLFWNYDETKLLPPRINLDQFAANPQSCLPLQKMFQLYGITNVQAEITEQRQGSANSLNNFLERIARRSTDHFHETWQEYDSIRFSLKMDGAELIAGIADESNSYELSQRSDGFKRFVTFLLLVSAEDASDLLKDWVLLIDEPEIGLHPSGARYLMKELVAISKRNYVVFTTHSIFMIDSQIINRHLIVKKKNEITEIDEVSESNIQDEEVIFKSLGYSIFSNLKVKNLLFEGWRDKRLFEVAMSMHPDGLDQLNYLGRCFANGVKDIKNIAPMFEAGDRKCFILTDNDPVAKEHQKRHLQDRGYGVWKRYDELVPGILAKTGEDFVLEDALLRAVNTVAREQGLPDMAVVDLGGTGTRLQAIKNWLDGKAGKKTGEIIWAIKDRIFDDLQPNAILPEYFDYLRAVLALTSK